VTPLARRRLRIGAALVLVALAIALAVTQLGTPSLDVRLVRRAADLRGGWFGDLMTFLSKIGYVRWLGPITVVAALLIGLVLHRWRDALLVGLSTVLAALVTAGAKQVFERVRPNEGVHELVAGFSMPSGHAAASAALATSVVIATFRTRLGMVVRVVAVAFALLVGLSRVVLGAHFPTDVLAGWALGAGVTLLVAAAIGATRRIP
jgi:undecaprenyl-diphosphatase